MGTIAKTKGTRAERFRKCRDECRKLVLEHYEPFVRLGARLKEIRDDKLYREGGFNSWEAYCASENEFGLGKRYSNRLIQSSDLRQQIGAVPQGKTTPIGVDVSVWTENSVRTLGLKVKASSDRKRIAKKVENLALKEEIPIGKALTRVLKEETEPKKKAKKKSEEAPPPDLAKLLRKWIDEVETVASHFERIAEEMDLVEIFATYRAQAFAMEKAVNRLCEALGYEVVR